MNNCVVCSTEISIGFTFCPSCHGYAFRPGERMMEAEPMLTVDVKGYREPNPEQERTRFPRTILKMSREGRILLRQDIERLLGK